MSGSGYVPQFRMLLDGLGLDALEPPALEGGQPVTGVETRFLDFLLTEFARLLPFDAAFYAETYPDLAVAQRRGTLPDLHEHFVRLGFREGRLGSPPVFDPVFYGTYSDLAGLKLDGGHAGLLAHYQGSGRFEGRAATAAQEVDAGRWVNAIRATPYRLAHRSMDSVTVQAFRHPLAAGPPLGFRGGPVLGDGATDLRLRHRRGKRAVDSFPVRDGPVGLLAGEHVYGGPSFDHFGHAMAEMIHRVLPARALFDCRRLLFVGTGEHGGAVTGMGGFEMLPGVMQAPLRFLGVEAEDVTVIHDDRVVERLHIVEQGSDLTGGPAAPYLDMLASYTPAMLDALDDGTRVGARLYVSRSRIPYGGVLLGERYVERLMEAEGWMVFHPQDWPLVAQMQAYRRAEVIIFGEGSACHGVELFGRNGLRRTVLLPRRHGHRGIFENVLRPRSGRFDLLPSATLLGSVVGDPDTGVAQEHMGVSVLDLPGLAHALRALGLAEWPRLDPPAYRAAARKDLAAYREWHGKAGTPTVPSEELTAFEARCAAAVR